MSDFDEFRVLLRLSGFEEDLLEVADSFRGHYLDEQLKLEAERRYQELIENFALPLRYEIEVNTDDILQVTLRVLPRDATHEAMPTWLQYTISYK